MGILNWWKKMLGSKRQVESADVIYRVGYCSPGDAVELISLDIKCFSYPWSNSRWAEILNGNEISVAVRAFANIVACMVVRHHEESVEILKVMVHPDHRKRGLSRHLVNSAQMAVVSRGVKTLSITAPESLVYQQHGWFDAVGFRAAKVDKSLYIDCGQIEDGIVFTAEMVEYDGA